MDSFKNDKKQQCQRLERVNQELIKNGVDSARLDFSMIAPDPMYRSRIKYPSKVTVVKLRPIATSDPKTPKNHQKGHDVRLVE